MMGYQPPDTFRFTCTDRRIQIALSPQSTPNHSVHGGSSKSPSKELVPKLSGGGGIVRKLSGVIVRPDPPAAADTGEAGCVPTTRARARSSLPESILRKCMRRTLGRESHQPLTPDTISPAI